MKPTRSDDARFFSKQLHSDGLAITASLENVHRTEQGFAGTIVYSFRDRKYSYGVGNHGDLSSFLKSAEETMATQVAAAARHFRGVGELPSRFVGAKLKLRDGGWFDCIASYQFRNSETLISRGISSHLDLQPTGDSTTIAAHQGVQEAPIYNLAIVM